MKLNLGDNEFMAVTKTIQSNTFINNSGFSVSLFK